MVWIIRRYVPLEGDDKMGKIFGIGLSGTGTRSLSWALITLGYTVKHYPFSLEEIAMHDASADISVSCRYRELDKMFIDSRFILTTRDRESWLDCRQRKPPDEQTPPLWVLETRLRTYGVLSYDRETYIKVYEDYHKGVTDYFRNRPGDLLTMNILEGDGWEKLCSFLGLDTIPGTPFPCIRGSERGDQAPMPRDRFHSRERRKRWWNPGG